MLHKKNKINRNNNWIDTNLSPVLLLLNGLALLILNLITQSFPDKIILCCGLIALNLLRRKRIKLLTQVIFILTLILLNLYPPYGRVLFHLFTFTVTEAALINGFTKGITLVSFIFIARYGISSSLKLPGTIGMLVTKTLFYLDLLQNEQKNLYKGKVLEKIDQLILNLWESGDTLVIKEAVKSTIAGILFAILNILIICILLYLI